MNYETKEVKETLELSLQKKLKYIKSLKNQQSEFKDTLDQTKRKIEEYEHIERLLKLRINYLTSENTKFRKLIDIEKSQNECLANDLKDNKTEHGESCKKSQARSALNTDLLNQLECIRNELSTTIKGHEQSLASCANALNQPDGCRTPIHSALEELFHQK